MWWRFLVFSAITRHFSLVEQMKLLKPLILVKFATSLQDGAALGAWAPHASTEGPYGSSCWAFGRIAGARGRRVDPNVRFSKGCTSHTSPPIRTIFCYAYFKNFIFEVLQSACKISSQTFFTAYFL